MALNHLRKYFRALGIEPTDDPVAIKKAYRQMALKYHPDRNSRPEAHQRFVEVIEAYEVLTGQRKARIFTSRARTKEDIIKEKVQAAKERWERQQAEEIIKDEIYYKNVAFGWKWTFFRVAASYSLLFTVLLCVDVFTISERRTVPQNAIFINQVNHSIVAENEGERFYISNLDFWGSDFWGGTGYSPIRGNYSYLFHDLKSISIIVSDENKWAGLNHSSKMRGFADFEEFELETFRASDSMYGAFPFIHIILLVPTLLVLFKRPTLRFNLWRLVSLWIIFPFFVFLTFSNDRIFHLFRFFE